MAEADAQAAEDARPSSQQQSNAAPEAKPKRRSRRRTRSRGNSTGSHNHAPAPLNVPFSDPTLQAGLLRVNVVNPKFHPRNCHSAIAWPPERIVYFGGYIGSRWTNDVHVLHTGSLASEVVATNAAPKASKPPPRYSHSANLVNESSMLVFGGFGDGGVWLNDVHELDLTNMTWTQPTFAGEPPTPRAAHTASLIGNKLFVFGGNIGDGCTNDIVVLDLEKKEWIRPEVTGSAPEPRAGHSAAVVGDLIVIFGGGDIGTMFNDTYVLDTNHMCWYPLSCSGHAPHPRAGHSSVAINGEEILIIGGNGHMRVFSDAFVLNTATCHWSGVDICGYPMPPRAGFATVECDSKIFLCGGSDSTHLHGDVYCIESFARAGSGLQNGHHFPSDSVLRNIMKANSVSLAPSLHATVSALERRQAKGRLSSNLNGRTGSEGISTDASAQATPLDASLPDRESAYAAAPTPPPLPVTRSDSSASSSSPTPRTAAFRRRERRKRAERKKNESIREQIASLLSNRPSASELRARNIMPTSPVAAALQATTSRIDRQMSERAVGRLLQNRPPASALVERNIMGSPQVAPSLGSMQRRLEKQQRVDTLSQHLKERPPRSELVTRQIIAEGETGHTTAADSNEETRVPTDMLDVAGAVENAESVIQRHLHELYASLDHHIAAAHEVLLQREFALVERERALLEHERELFAREQTLVQERHMLRSGLESTSFQMLEVMSGLHESLMARERMLAMDITSLKRRAGKSPEGARSRPRSPASIAESADSAPSPPRCGEADAQTAQAKEESPEVAATPPAPKEPAGNGGEA